MTNNQLPNPMNEDKLEELLSKLKPTPRNSFHKRMEWVTHHKNEKRQIEMTKKTYPRLALATVALLLILTALFAAPQGRAFAQNILQYFVRTDEKVRPLPEGQIPSTEDQDAPTAVAPAPLVSVTEAEKTAGFDAKELPSTPNGFEFAGAMAIGNGISIQYQARGNGGQLVINESTNGFMESDWDQTPTDAITPVKIGDLDAEFVQGTFVVYPNETVARWNPDAPILRLRWIQDGVWFEMTKFGNVESIEYLDQAGLIALAGQLQ